MTDTSQSYASPLDPRVRRTRRLLSDALLDLAAERSFDEITVRDISSRADVNRNTFYLHYRDKQDLVDHVLEALFDDVTREVREYVDAHKQPAFDETPAPLVAMLREFERRPELFLRLLSSASGNRFAYRFAAFHQEEFLAVWNEMNLEPASGSAPAELRAATVASVIAGAIVWWLSQGTPNTADELGAWIWSTNRGQFFDNVV